MILPCAVTRVKSFANDSTVTIQASRVKEEEQTKNKAESLEKKTGCFAA